ncbi:MAG: ABC transporter substrate-binding protein [Thermomicrobiales bacterium]
MSESMPSTGRQLTRRQFVTASAGAVGVALASRGLPIPALAAQEAIARGGTFRTNLGTGLPTLNPTISSFLGGLYNLMYDSLIRYRLVDPATRTYEVLPALAETWAWNEDNTEITFTLRQGVKFHDGSDWNADVAKWNFDLMMTHEQSFAKPFVESIESVEVVDPANVRLKLKGPSAPLLANLSNSSGRVFFISQAQYEQLGEAGFGENPSGTGPMRFDSWIKENQVTLTRFDGYWQQGEDGQPLPYLDGAQYRLIPEAQTALVELMSGNLEYLEIDPKDAATVQGNGDLTLDPIPASGSFYVVLGLNQTVGLFGENIGVRKAALTALNREAIMNVISFGQATLAPYPYWYEGMIGYDSTLPRYDYDVEAAQALLTDAGFPDGVDIKLTVIQRPLEQQMAEIIKQMWDEVGIRTELEILERTAWIAKLREGKDYDAAFWRAIFPADPDQNGQLLLTGAQSNWGSYSNPEIDRLMGEARTTLDTAQRQELYRQVQQHIYDDACVGQAFYLPTLAAYRNALNGFTADANQPRFHEAWLTQ